MNNIQELRKIIADAPEGATHYKNEVFKSDTVFYYKVDDFCWYFWGRNQWFPYPSGWGGGVVIERAFKPDTITDVGLSKEQAETIAELTR